MRSVFVVHLRMLFSTGCSNAQKDSGAAMILVMMKGLELQKVYFGVHTRHCLISSFQVCC